MTAYVNYHYHYAIQISPILATPVTLLASNIKVPSNLNNDDHVLLSIVTFSAISKVFPIEEYCLPFILTQGFLPSLAPQYASIQLRSRHSLL